MTCLRSPPADICLTQQRLGTPHPSFSFVIGHLPIPTDHMRLHASNDWALCGLAVYRLSVAEGVVPTHSLLAKLFSLLRRADAPPLSSPPVDPNGAAAAPWSSPSPSHYPPYSHPTSLSNGVHANGYASHVPSTFSQPDSSSSSISQTSSLNAPPSMSPLPASSPTAFPHAALTGNASRFSSHVSTQSSPLTSSYGTSHGGTLLPSDGSFAIPAAFSAPSDSLPPSQQDVFSLYEPLAYTVYEVRGLAPFSGWIPRDEWYPMTVDARTL